MRTDLIWRALVPVAATATLLLDVPSPVPGLLALVGLGLAAERLARLRALGPGDRALVGVGGLVVTVVLVGMVLGSTSIGLSPTTWTVALAVAALAGLALAGLVPSRSGGVEAPPAGHRRTALLLTPWLAGAVAVVAVSVNISGASLARTEQDPLAMSLGRISDTQVEVVVQASAAVGPLELRTEAEDNEVSYPLLTVPEDGTVTTTVALPRTGRFVIALSYPDQTQPLRTLVLDR